MAIGSNAAIDVFGTQDELGTNNADLTDGSFSSGLSWTNDDDAPFARIVLGAHFNTAPDVGGYINVHARRLNIAETSGDEPVPSADWKGGLVGAIPVDDITTDQYPSCTIPLDNIKTSQEYEFYFENRAGQTLGDSAGSDHWRAWITPVTRAPHA